MTTNKQLRELAEKATPGTWWIDSHGHRMSANGGSETVFIASEKMGEAKRHPETGNLSHWPNDWDASYIAAANPERVLALLDEIEALQSENEKLRKDAERIDRLADPNNSIGNVQLPMVIVRQHLHSLRDAIDAAMEDMNHE